MSYTVTSDFPEIYEQLEVQTKALGFSMGASTKIGQLLSTLVSSKPGGRFLELGTGTGLSLAWMVKGLSEEAKIISIDNNLELIQLAQNNFKAYSQVELVHEDGTTWINQYKGAKFDLIFADAWPGKYSQLEETLNLLNVGGWYVIDDMMEQDNWPDGHAEKATTLLQQLEQHKSLNIVHLQWATGIVLATKIKP